MWTSRTSTECCGCRRASAPRRDEDDDDEDGLPQVVAGAWPWRRAPAAPRTSAARSRGSAPGRTSRGGRGSRGQCRMAAALSLAILLTCSLVSRPARAAQAGAAGPRPGPWPGPWPGPARSGARGPPWPAGPARQAARHTRNAPSRHLPSRTTVKPWVQPCGQGVAAQPVTGFLRLQRPNKHSGHRDFDYSVPTTEGGSVERKGWSLRALRRKIRIARNHLRHRRSHIHQVYGQVKVLSNKYSFDWLPQQSVVPWYKSELTCLDRDSQAAHFLPVLRSALQNFSATFVELQKARRHSIDQPGLGNRSLIINELASHVKGMLCEVETAMQERSLPLPPSGLPAEGLSDMDPARWNQNPDLTGALIQDWGVVSAYTDAIIGWSLIIRELGHAPKLRGQRGPAPVATPGCPDGRPPFVRPRPRSRNNVRVKKRRHPGAGEAGGLVGVDAGKAGQQKRPLSKEQRLKRRHRRRLKRKRKEEKRRIRRLRRLRILMKDAEGKGRAAPAS